jgi:hypothetical protein
MKVGEYRQMVEPKKHHYLPQFYQRRWAGEDRKVTAYQRYGSKLSILRKSPKGVGYVEELYSIPSETDPAKRQRVESQFMRGLDNDAADALTFMEQQGAPRDPRRRLGWTRFITSLIHRAPRRLDHFRQRLAEEQNLMLETLKTAYPQKRGPNDPATYEEYVALNELRLAGWSHAEFLQTMIDSEKIQSTIYNMFWNKIDLNRLNFPLLTGDLPLIRSNGLGIKGGFLILPISPSSFFIAANRTEVITSFTSQPAKRLGRALNDSIVRQSEIVIIAPNERQTDFINKRFRVATKLEGDGERDKNGDITWLAPYQFAEWE